MLQKIPLYLTLAVLVGCAGAGLQTADNDPQKYRYARATLDSVYDGVIYARTGCAEVPKPSTCKLSDTDKSNVLSIADAGKQVLKDLDDGKATTAGCLSTMNAGLEKAGRPPVQTAVSCLTLVNTILTTLQETIPK